MNIGVNRLQRLLSNRDSVTDLGYDEEQPYYESEMVDAVLQIGGIIHQLH